MGVDVIMVATFLAAVATFAVLVAIYAATTVRDPMAKRVKALNERREQLKAGIVASTSKRRRNITNKNEMADKVRGVLGSLKMLQHEQVEKAQKRLMQAGIRSKDLAFVVIFARLVLPVAIGVVVVLGVYVIEWFPHWGALKRYGLVATSLILAYKAPDIWLRNRITKRSHGIRKGLPDALDLLVICVEAGLGLNAALKRVGHELKDVHPEINYEFELVNLEINVGRGRDEALHNLADRTGVDDIRSFVALMIQADKFGSSIGRAVRVFSDSLRTKRRQRAEQLAQKAALKLLFPLTLFLFPTIIIAVLGTAVLNLMDMFAK